jgi:hypothetical protein
MQSVNWAAIISAAAGSRLGVLSLIVLAVALIGWSFFNRSDDRVKLWVFGAILVASVGFGAATIRESQASTDAPHPAGGTGAVVDNIAATAAPANMPPGSAPPPAESIAGLWRDDDGFTYHFHRSGNRIRYTQVQVSDGAEVGSGAGTISGRTLQYHYVDGAGAGGRCVATLAPRGDTISGTCTSGVHSWPFAIVRAD